MLRLSRLCWIVSFVFFLPYTKAHAEENYPEPAPVQYRYSITWNPLLPILAQAAFRDLEEEGERIAIGISDFNLRFHNRLQPRIGFFVQVDYTQLSFFTQTTQQT